jgi:hypothetical protein
MHRQSGRFVKSHVPALGATSTAALLVLSAFLVQAPAGFGHPAKLTNIATSGTPRANVPLAHGTRTISLNESGNLQLTSRRGFTLNEKGPASGTVKGTIYVHLRIVSTTRVTAEVNIYPSGGSITGYGTASYHREGATGNFSGSLSVDRGTGSYNNAHGSGLSFTGTIQRSNYAITVHVSGTVNE